MELADFHFIRPWWFIALPPLMWLLWRYARQRLSQSSWADVIDPQLLPFLLDHEDTKNSSMQFISAFALLLAIFALSGPTWERLPQPVSSKDDSLVIVLDLSLSMYIADVSPTRISKARQKITDLLQLREEGNTGLVVYAGDAHIVAPLTNDINTIENLLKVLEPGIMPAFGSDVESALALAREMLKTPGASRGHIIIVTDEVSRVASVTQFAERDIPISILGIGTPAGGPIPLDFANQPGRLLLDDSGNQIVATLDADKLQTIASITYGEYRTAGVGDTDIEALLASAPTNPDLTITDERTFDVWEDRGVWLALLLVPILLMSFRRGALLCLACVLVTPNLEASLWDDLWSRRDQQGYRALIEGQPEKAESLFSEDEWRAAARFRAENYQGARQLFEQTPGIEALYNQGNSRALSGDLQGAVDAYDQILQVSPDHVDAKLNKAVVEKYMEENPSNDGNDNQQQQNDQQDENSDPSDDPSEGEESEDSEEQQDGEETEGEGQKPEDKEQQEQQMAESDETVDEDENAAEQWLRRIPDDPGGLLRRKFQHETNLRLRRGEYQSKDDNQIW